MQYTINKFRMSKNCKEPMLVEDDDRFVMFPIKDEDVWKMY